MTTGNAQRLELGRASLQAESTATLVEHEVTTLTDPPGTGTRTAVTQRGGAVAGCAYRDRGPGLRGERHDRRIYPDLKTQCRPRGSETSWTVERPALRWGQGRRGPRPPRSLVWKW